MDDSPVAPEALAWASIAGWLPSSNAAIKRTYRYRIFFSFLDQLIDESRQTAPVAGICWSYTHFA
jgi:hypothetical protein